MVKKLPAAVTKDGFLDPNTLGEIYEHPELMAPSIDGHMVVKLRDDTEIGRMRTAMQRDALQVIGKSGHSQSLLQIQANRENGHELSINNRGEGIIPVTLSSLRSIGVRRSNTKDKLLRTLWHATTAETRPMYVGRLASTAPDSALNKGEIIDAIRQHQIAFGPSFSQEKDISDDGCIDLQLDDSRYQWFEENFDEESQRQVLRFGKHALKGLLVPGQGKPDQIKGLEGFVGSFRVSIGPYVGIIDHDTNTDDVFHLAARVLDGIKTTGLSIPRQAEIFNKSMNSIALGNVRIRLRLYHGNRELQNAADHLINKRTIHEGVSFSDIANIADEPNELMRILKHVSPTPNDNGAYGYLIGNKRSAELSWVAAPEAHDRNIAMRNQKFGSEEPDYCSLGKDVPEFARKLSEKIGYAGQEQNQGKLCATWAFPPPEVMGQMLDNGTGVFIAHDVIRDEEVYGDEESLLDENGKLSEVKVERFYLQKIKEIQERNAKKGHPRNKGLTPTKKKQLRENLAYVRNGVYFDSEHFSAIQRLHRRGARFLLARHKTPDAFEEGNIMDEEILEWHKRGLWVRPSEKERLEKIDTTIAMYGSHVPGMEKEIEEQIERFALRMKKRFGNTVAFMHGKGPGLMYTADKVAKNLVEIAEKHGEEDIEENMFSIGVGISAERFGQDPNFHPPAQLDFHTKDRLTRQKHMNDRSTFNIFNIGGAGTLEEIALTLCSSKLLKNIPTPMIFVDPVGLGRDKENLWAEFGRLIETLAEKKEITIDEAKQAKANIQLLQGYWSDFVEVVDSYDEAGDIIERFADDPAAYYKEKGMPKSDVEQSYKEQIEVCKETGFSIPDFLRPDRVLHSEAWDQAS